MRTRCLLQFCCCAALLMSACADPEYQEVNYTQADFVGQWDTTLPNGERWLLVLHENGHFESIPVHSPRPGIAGEWQMEAGKFYWKYPDTSGTGRVRGEINPIIMKTKIKFMLQERMGMKSVYMRHAE